MWKAWTPTSSGVWRLIAAKSDDRVEKLEQDVEIQTDDSEAMLVAGGESWTMKNWNEDVGHQPSHEVLEASKTKCLEKLQMPDRSEKAFRKIRKEPTTNQDLQNETVRNVMWRSPDFLRHVLGSLGETRSITLTYV